MPQERWLDTFFASSTVGLAILDRDLHYVRVNESLAAINGLPVDAHVGRTVAEVVPLPHLEIERPLRTVLETGRPVILELAGAPRATGRTGHWTVCCYPIAGPDRATDGIGVIIADTAELKAMQSQLLVSDRMVTIGMLAAGVAHEINNPLAVIKANLDLAAAELARIGGGADARPELADLAEYVREAQDAAERVRLTVRELNTFSRATDAEERSEIDVRRVLDSMLRLAGNEIRYRARLVRDFGPVPLVDGNESRLGQVFLNLVVNAAQAIGEGRAEQNEIRVTTRTGDDGTAIIEISDTGEGMSPEVEARLFTPFFTTKPVGTGTGLGLPICHQIVDSLGGTIVVETRLGKGSTFRVALPPSMRASAPASPPLPSPAPAPEPPAGVAPRRASLLIVDDEPAIGASLSRTLRNDYDVVTSTSAAEALALIVGGRKFDVVLCDLIMPQMTGMDLHAELLRVAPEQASRMIFVSGGAFTAAARRFLEEVPNPRLDKPFDLGQLRAVIREMLR